MLLRCEQAPAGEMGSGSSVYLLIHQARGFYHCCHIILSLSFFFFLPPPPLVPRRTGGLSKCALTAEVTLSARPDLGAVCLHLAAYLQMPGKRAKVIFCVWPAGKSEANDPGRVDCYLAPRNSTSLLGAGTRERGAGGRDEEEEEEDKAAMGGATSVAVFLYLCVCLCVRSSRRWDSGARRLGHRIQRLGGVVNRAGPVESGVQLDYTEPWRSPINHRDI